MGKIVKPEEVTRDGKVVLCQGCFDLLHIGHVKHLSSAKKYGDILVVAVTADKYVNKGPDRPVFNQQLRMEHIAALGAVDYVVLSDAASAIPIIDAVKPDFYIKGQEYEQLDQDITGKIAQEKEAVEAHGGKFIVTNEITFSSTNLLNNFFNVMSQEATAFLDNFSHSAEDVIAYLDKIADLNILVIGETIFDQYSFVSVKNTAAKHSVLSSHFERQETHLGGVLATARHLSQFCNNVEVITCLSHDVEVPFTLHRIPVPEKFDIYKERFVDEKNKQLFRVDYMEGKSHPGSSKQIIDKLQEKPYDLVIVNDFGHGMITSDIIEALEEVPFLALNVQTNSANKGFNLVTKYVGADYISIDLPEGRLAIGEETACAGRIGRVLSLMMEFTILSITHGKFGTCVFDEEAQTHIRVPVFSSETIDTTGAGDAYFAITSALAYLNAPLEVIGLVGNAVGSLATRIMGNREAISAEALKKYIITLTKR